MADEMADLRAYWEISNWPQPRVVPRDLAAGTGLRCNGDTPWDIQISDERVYWRILYRMWKCYLLLCYVGFFRSRQGQLWQLVLSKRQQRSGVYRLVR